MPIPGEWLLEVRVGAVLGSSSGWTEGELELRPNGFNGAALAKPLSGKPAADVREVLLKGPDHHLRVAPPERVDDRGLEVGGPRTRQTPSEETERLDRERRLA